MKNKLPKRTDLNHILATLQKQDVLFLYKTIRGALPSIKPQKGWRKDLDAGDMSFGGDVERIRKYRNCYVHSLPAEFNESKLESDWNDILYLFKRVDQYFLDEHKKETSFHAQAKRLQPPRGIYLHKCIYFCHLGSIHSSYLELFGLAIGHCFKYTIIM